MHIFFKKNIIEAPYKQCVRCGVGVSRMRISACGVQSTFAEATHTKLFSQSELFAARAVTGVHCSGPAEQVQCTVKL